MDDDGWLASKRATTNLKGKGNAFALNYVFTKFCLLARIQLNT